MANNPKTVITGDKELIETLEHLGGYALKNVMKPAVNKALTPINKEAKRLAPVRSKNLRKSIGKKVKATRKKVTGKITIRKGYGGAAKYAHMVEFGTRYMPARSFMRAAMANKKEQAMSLLREVAWYRIEQEVDKMVARGEVRRVLGGVRRLR
jgi:HK97 gp10 family phage protein